MIKKTGSVYRIDGKEYPSVTSILSQINKPAVNQWMIGRAIDAGIKFGNKDQARAALWASPEADAGKEAHAVAARFGTATRKLQDTGNTYYKAIESFFTDTGAIPIHVECVVFETWQHKYAGTIDLIAKMPDGKTMLVDWKTSKAIYPEYRIQIAAYCFASRLETLNGKIVSMPRTDTTAIVLLKKDGTYETEILTGREQLELREIFTGLLKLHEYYERLK